MSYRRPAEMEIQTTKSLYKMKNQILFLCFFFVTCSFAISQEPYAITWQECFLKRCDDDVLSRVKFGYLEVPENYSEPKASTIKVAFTVIKSAHPNPEPDPVLIFAGGWGMPELESTVGYAKNFPVKNRDLILFDYRGSGYSQPTLCPDLGQQIWESIAEDLLWQEFQNRMRSLSMDCLDTLRASGIDVGQYGTETKTRDAVELMKSLEIATINLFGISNGTMGIQGFLRNAEKTDVMVRSIISDSNVPMAVSTQGKMVEFYKDALNKVLDDCANDPKCNKAYPDLQERFQSFLKESQEDPLIYDGVRRLVFNSYEINGVVHQLLYNGDNYKDIPMFLDAMISRQIDFFDLFYDRFQRLVTAQNGTSIINYVYDWNAFKKEGYADYKQQLAQSPEYMPVDLYIDFYGRDTTLQFNPSDTIAVTSKAQALILAGDNDPITPPAWSKMMHQRYDKSHYIELSNVGHGAARTPCGTAIFTSFLENPAERPNNDCAEAMKTKVIPFTVGHYENPHMANFSIGLFQEKKLFPLVVVALAILSALVLFISRFVKAIRKKGLDFIPMLQSALILVLLVGLFLYIRATLAHGGLLLAFGLVEGASWLPWLALTIMGLMLVGIILFIRAKKLNFGAALFLVASIAVCILSVEYGLLPF